MKSDDIQNFLTNRDLKRANSLKKFLSGEIEYDGETEIKQPTYEYKTCLGCVFCREITLPDNISKAILCFAGTEMVDIKKRKSIPCRFFMEVKS